MSLLTTKPARSMMYAVSIGGLLVCNGFMVMLIWNDLLADVVDHPHHLSFLEGTGITAFAYVLVFAVKYGRATGVSRTRTPSAAQRCAEMTPEQRSALRNELVQSCGCSETPTKS